MQVQINDVINDEPIEDAIVTNILRKMQGGATNDELGKIKHRTIA
jgi:hypothetical protein